MLWKIFNVFYLIFLYFVIRLKISSIISGFDVLSFYGFFIYQIELVMGSH